MGIHARTSQKVLHALFGHPQAVAKVVLQLLCARALQALIFKRVAIQSFKLNLQLRGHTGFFSRGGYDYGSKSALEFKRNPELKGNHLQSKPWAIGMEPALWNHTIPTIYHIGTRVPILQTPPQVGQNDRSPLSLIGPYAGPFP